MTLSLITEQRDYAICAMIAGDPEKTVVGHITYQPKRDDNDPAETWLADAFGIGEQRSFLSRIAAEYWLLAMVTEYEAISSL